MSMLRKLLVNLMIVVLVAGLFLTACQSAEPPAAPTLEPPATTAAESVELPATESKIGKNTILVGIGEWEPWHSEKLKHFGVASHIITEAFHQVGINVEYKFLPWKRGFQESVYGNLDAYGIYGGYDDWMETHHGSDPVCYGPYVIWVRKGTHFKLSDPKSLNGLTLGIGLEEGVHEKFQKAVDLGYLQVEKTESVEQTIEKLLLGRIDLFAKNYDVGLEYINKIVPENKRDQIVLHPEILRLSLYRLLFSKANGRESINLREKFNIGLHMLRQEGKIEEMLKANRRGEYKQ